MNVYILKVAKKNRAADVSVSRLSVDDIRLKVKMCDRKKKNGQKIRIRRTYEHLTVHAWPKCTTRLDASASF